MSTTSPDWIASFAKLQAHEDARVVVQELLSAATLPADHPMAALAQEMADGPLLLAGMRIRLATILGRLEAGHQREVSSCYATSYQREFLRSLQRELRIYLAGAFQGLMPEESHPAARRVLGVVEHLIGEHMAAQEAKPADPEQPKPRRFQVRVGTAYEDVAPAESYSEEDLLCRFPRLAPLLARADFTGCHWQESTETGWHIISITLTE